MPHVNPLPCPPGEDYNHNDSQQIALSSIIYLLESFDAVMDSLESSTEKLNRRVDQLFDRYEVAKKHISEEKTTTLTSPESYPKAQGQHPKAYNTSFLKEARDNSNKVIEECIQKEKRIWMEGDNNIKLSDNWLDRGDAFEEELLNQMYASSHTMPLLDANGISSSNDGDAAPENASRTQQGLSGSTPFLCELLHDSYGSQNLLGDKDSFQVLPVVEDLQMLRNHSSTITPAPNTNE